MTEGMNINRDTAEPSEKEDRVVGLFQKAPR